MAITGNWLVSLKVVLISTGVLSLAFVLKLSVPVISDFLTFQVPLIWSFVLSWLRPPYLYLVINCLIIIIVASSRFQKKADESPDPVPVKVISDVRTEYDYNNIVSKDQVDASVANNAQFKQVDGIVTYVNVKTKPNESEKGEDEFVISRSSWAPKRKESLDYSAVLAEKPLVSVRFGHRRTVKSSPEGGKALGVSRPKRHDTLESTWKTITDGRSMPLTRHLKKSETFNAGPQVPSPQPSFQEMKKSETFNDRSTAVNNGSPTPSPASGKLRKEPSPSQDELNRRVEAFIKKFNEEMRLQRQQSLDQYKEMISRGAH